MPSPYLILMLKSDLGEDSRALIDIPKMSFKPGSVRRYHYQVNARPRSDRIRALTMQTLS